MNKSERDKLARYVSEMINSPRSSVSEVDRGRMMLEDFNIKAEYASYENVDMTDNAVGRIIKGMRDRACGIHGSTLTAIQLGSVRELARKFTPSNLDDDDVIWDLVSDYKELKGCSNDELDRWLNHTTHNLNECMGELIADPQWVNIVMEHLGTGRDRDIERQAFLLGKLDLETTITEMIENR